MKKYDLGPLVLALLAAFFFFAGCACTLCFGQATSPPEPPHPTPLKWRSTSRPPAPSPVAPGNDFETPPSDGGPDPTAPVVPPPAPPAPPVTTAPVGPPPTALGRPRASSWAETDGCVIINGNSGTIYIMCPCCRSGRSR